MYKPTVYSRLEEDNPISIMYNYCNAINLYFCAGSEQIKQIVFPPSKEPAFVTVPSSSYGEPFVLNPNTWSVVIEVEDVLLVSLLLQFGSLEMI